MADDPQAARPLQLAAVDLARSGAPVHGGGRRAEPGWRRSTGTRSRCCFGRRRCPSSTRPSRSGRSSSAAASALFFPPRTPGGGEFFGVRWTSWTDEKAGIPVVELAGRRGSARPHRERGAAAGRAASRSASTAGSAGEFTPLATSTSGAPLLARVATDHGARLLLRDHAGAGRFVAGDRAASCFYVLVQRALAAGAAALGSTRQLVAGEPPGDDPPLWKRVAGSRGGALDRLPVSPRRLRGGRAPAGGQPPAGGGLAPVLADAEVAELFRGLDFARVDDRAGSIELADPGDLADVPGRDDGRDGGRGRALSAQAGAAHGGPRHERIPVAHVPGHALVGRRSRSSPCWPRPVFCFVAWRRSGYRTSMGLLELLRLALVGARGGAAQPAGMGRRVPARGEAGDRRAVGRLGQHGYARRRCDRRARSATRPPITRREAIAALARDSTWQKLRERMNVVIQPFSRAAGRATAPT